MVLTFEPPSVIIYCKEEPMKSYPLSNFIDKHGQAEVAKFFGVNQSAISKALRSGRKITVLVHDDGRVEAEEIKPFPSYRYQTNFSA